MRPSSRLALPILAAGTPTPACRDAAEPHPNEFARGAAVWDESFSRRGFLAGMGASLALAGLTGGCSDRPSEPIVPYVDPPEQVVAGESQFFATTLTRGGYGRGVIVTSREDRPIKIEGNPDHPASLGAADAQMQAAILGLYDPLRSNTVTHAGKPTTWGAFTKALAIAVASHSDDAGAGMAVLTDPVTSPTIAALMGELKQRWPKLQWRTHQPFGREAMRSAHQFFSPHASRSILIGPEQRLEPIYDFTKADVIVAFDSDFLTDEPGSLAYARQFADCRRVTSVRPTMNRLYAAEADFSITGAQADHRLPAKPSRVAVLLQALATQMESSTAPTPTDLTPAEAAWLSAAATDLARTHGRSLIIVGPTQSATAQAIGLKLNKWLGNFDQTIRIDRSPMLSPNDRDAAGALAADITEGRVRSVLLLANNPVRTSPGPALAKALTNLSNRPDGFTAHLGQYANETAFVCQWHVPQQHELEQWGDATAHDGTISLVQPLIAPLTGGKNAIELLDIMLGRERSAYEIVRSVSAVHLGQGPAFEESWNAALRRGTLFTPAALSLPLDLAKADEQVVVPPTGIEIAIRPDASIGDGSLYHNPWLQELPRPLTKLVWGNAALMSPATADRHSLSNEQILRINQAVELPVLTLPGLADDLILLHAGYGIHRVTGGDVALNVAYGTDVFPLTALPMHGVTLSATDRTQPLVRTHNHHAMDVSAAAADRSMPKSLTPNVIATPATSHEDLELHNRKLIRTATLGQFFKSPDFAPKMDGEEIKQLYPGWDYSTGPQWGMTIDLTTCIGCNACIVACQAENNTPTVGPDQVAKEREMHWLRVDSYFDEAGRVHHQPVACMQCENAPCEYVCPVAATTHSVEGLNQMTYNRCVGTRYCSNNCPYKVRRFNFFNYTAPQPGSCAMQHNPDVTVRTRGVMEKCTYCVQRINYADRKTEIAALNAADAGGDPAAVRHDMLGRLQTACQQTCPTQAIHFGDLMNPNAAVTRDKHDPRNYGLLVELTTKPRTTYLASITNPSPSMEGGA